MIYLLDTHTLIWALIESSKLSDTAVEIIEDRKNKIYVSAISFWEVSLKTLKKKFSFTGLEIKEIPQLTEKVGFSLLPLKAEEAISYHDLPQMRDHKDPFDRMLIWQAIVNGFTLISKDPAFSQYKKSGLRLIW